MYKTQVFVPIEKLDEQNIKIPKDTAIFDDEGHFSGLYIEKIKTDFISGHFMNTTSETGTKYIISSINTRIHCVRVNIEIHKIDVEKEFKKSISE